MTNGIVNHIVRRGGKVRYLGFSGKDGRGLGNCSVTKHNNRLFIAARVPEYTFLPFPRTTHIFPVLPKYTSWNHLLLYEPDEDAFSMVREHYLDLDVESVNRYNGYEDARLVDWGKTLYASCTLPYGYNDSRFPIALNELDSRYETVSTQRYCANAIERNWMPITDRPFAYVYSVNPLQIASVGKNGVSCKKRKRTELLNTYKGSSQAIPYKNGHIAVIHSNTMSNETPIYIHHFIHWDEEWNVVKVSRGFTFAGCPREFCCGLYEEDCVVYMTFSLFDNAAFMLKTDLDTVENILNGEWDTADDARLSGGALDALFLTDENDATTAALEHLRGEGNIGGALALSLWNGNTALTEELLWEYMPDRKEIDDQRVSMSKFLTQNTGQ